MSDKELAIKLTDSTPIQHKCSICGIEATKKIRVENLKNLQKKNLCYLCDLHYSKLLNKMELSDIKWKI